MENNNGLEIVCGATSNDAKVSYNGITLTCVSKATIILDVDKVTKVILECIPNMSKYDSIFIKDVPPENVQVIVKDYK